MTQECPNCRHVQLNDAPVCSRCGTRFETTRLKGSLEGEGLRICAQCGVIAPRLHGYCSVCDAALESAYLAPAVPPELAWATVAVRFECRACGQLSPLNHMVVDGQVKCMHCGVERRFDASRWREVLNHARESANSPPAELSSTSAVLASAKLEGLEVRAAPGHPLCDDCSAPLRIEAIGVAALTVHCPSCATKRTYSVPPQASALCESLRGVVCADHELGRRDVQLVTGEGGAETVRCANCSAPLEVPDGPSLLRCQFCGVACRLTPEVLWRLGNKNLRARFWWLLFETEGVIPANLRNLELCETDKSSARERRPSGKGGCLFIGVTALLVIGVAVGMHFRDKVTPVASGAVLWNGNPLAYDVNGDGVFDVLGNVRVSAGEAARQLAAFDGRDGRNLWRSEVIEGIDSGSALADLAEDTVLVYRDRRDLRGYSANHGQRRFIAQFNENIDRLCGSAQAGSVVVRTKDEQFHTVRLADGAIREDVLGDYDCPPITRTLPLLIRSDHFNHDSPIAGSRIDGMRTDLTLRLPSSDILVAIGEKNLGTRVPRLAAFRSPDWINPTIERKRLYRARFAAKEADWPALDAKIGELQRIESNSGHSSNIDVLWVADVPGIDPLACKEGKPDVNNVGLQGDTLVVNYAVDFAETKRRQTAFSLATGQRLWDVGGDDVVAGAGLIVTPHHVFASSWNQLSVFDVKTGRFLYSLK